MFWACAVLILMRLLIQYQGCAVQGSNFRLEVSPRVVHIAANNPATILCKAVDKDNKPVPISKCQFYAGSQLLDLSGGANTTHSPLYHGAGLKNGECGVTLKRSEYNNLKVVGCRVMADHDRQWQYGSAIINADRYQDKMSYKLEPREAVVREGGSINISGLADQALEQCVFNLPVVGDKDFHFGPDSAASKDNHLYFGAGLTNKACGITLKNIRPDWGGHVVGFAYDFPTRSYPIDFITLIVLTPPEMPMLMLVNPNLTYKHGDHLEATCVVANSRPVSNITWLLDDQVIRQDTIDDSPLNDTIWRWSYEPQTMTQHLKRVVTYEDDGKQLTCRADHLALPEGTANSTIRIAVQDSWSPSWPWYIGLVLVLLVVAVLVATWICYIWKICCFAKYRKVLGGQQTAEVDHEMNEHGVRKSNTEYAE